MKIIQYVVSSYKELNKQMNTVAKVTSKTTDFVEKYKDSALFQNDSAKGLQEWIKEQYRKRKSSRLKKNMKSRKKRKKHYAKCGMGIEYTRKPKRKGGYFSNRQHSIFVDLKSQTEPSELAKRLLSNRSKEIRFIAEPTENHFIDSFAYALNSKRSKSFLFNIPTPDILKDFDNGLSCGTVIIDDKIPNQFYTDSINKEGRKFIRKLK